MSLEARRNCYLTLASLPGCPLQSRRCTVDPGGCSVVAYRSVIVFQWLLAVPPYRSTSVPSATCVGGPIDAMDASPLGNSAEPSPPLFGPITQSMLHDGQTGKRMQCAPRGRPLDRPLWCSPHGPTWPETHGEAVRGQRGGGRGCVDIITSLTAADPTTPYSTRRTLRSFGSRSWYRRLRGDRTMASRTRPQRSTLEGVMAGGVRAHKESSRAAAGPARVETRAWQQTCITEARSMDAVQVFRARLLNLGVPSPGSRLPVVNATRTRRGKSWNLCCMI